MTGPALFRLVVWCGALLLCACQSDGPAPDLAAAPPPDKPIVLAVKKPARPRHAEPPCRTAAALSAQRKEALFRLFAEQQGTGALPVHKAAAPACRPVAH